MKSSDSEVNSMRMSRSCTSPAAIIRAGTGAPLLLVRARNRGMSSVVAGM